MTPRDSVQVLIILRQYFIFDLCHLLIVHLVQKRARHLLGFTRKIAMGLQQTPQDGCGLIRFQPPQGKLRRTFSSCPSLRLITQKAIVSPNQHSKVHVALGSD
jgi:hypothetical protein